MALTDWLPTLADVTRGAKNVVNNAGEHLADAGQSIENGISGAVRAVRAPLAGPDPWDRFPTYMRNLNAQAPAGEERSRQQYARTLLGNYDPATLPQQMPATIPGYRADPTGKFGGKDGLETQPYNYLDPVELYAHARAMAQGKAVGIPQLSATQLAALALKEGKSYFGVNPVIGKDAVTYYDPNNPDSAATHEKLVNAGVNPRVAGFPTYLRDKFEAATRLKIPWTEAWNGTGNAGNGLTGKDYAASYKNFETAAASPKNAALVKFIQSAIDAEDPAKRAYRWGAPPAQGGSWLSQLLSGSALGGGI